MAAMKTTAIALLAVSLFVVTASAARSESEPSHTLTGQYVWTYQNTPGDLEAVFTRTGEGRYDVVFHFTFDGQPRAYRGTAEGSLSEGTLSGTVKNENRRRTFVFDGAVSEGTFRGTHAEIRRGKERRTGTLTLTS